MLGIDTIIGLAGLAIAIPGLVQTFIYAGRYLSNRLRSNVESAEAAKIKDFIVFIQCGTMRTTLENVEDLYFDTSDINLRLALQKSAEELWGKMIELDQQIKILSTASSNDSKAKKAKQRAHESIESMYSMEETLRNHVQAQVFSKSVPSRLQLRLNQYSIIGSLSQPLYSSVRTCSGDFYTPNRRGRELCVIEEKTFPGLPSNQAYDAAVALARTLQFANSNEGILSLVGFQEVRPTSQLEPDRFQLVFSFPKGYGNPRSLRDILLDPINKPMPPIPRNYRFILPRKLAEAVYHVHEQNLVHKCIRPESILLFEPDGNSPQLKYPKVIGKPFLTDWRYVRKSPHASRQQPHDGWTIAMYQHPERQADPPSSAAYKYHIGHDIYSLGVCLLEIGLWHSFIIYNNRIPSLSKLLSEAKSKWKLENAAVSKAMGDAEIEQKAFILLAGDRLEYEMGELYSKLVIKCLTCVEHGFGNVLTFVDSASRDWEEQGFLFIQAIQKELTQASTMGVGNYNKLL